MQQTAFLDCVAFNHFSLEQDGLAPSKVNISGREIIPALMITLVIVVIDEPVDTDFKITR
jgi:hypothetical protein